MVRLKVIQRWISEFIDVEFQFQNGTIKRQETSHGKTQSANFNSKMVRLKVRARRRRPVAMAISIPKWYD